MHIYRHISLQISNFYWSIVHQMKNLWYLQQGITLKYSNWNWYHFCTCPHHLRFLYHNCRTSWQGLMLTSTNPHQSFFLLKKCKIILCGWQTDGQDPFWQSLDYRSASSCWSLGVNASDVAYMTQLLLLGKFEYTGGPIFKVVLEC